MSMKKVSLLLITGLIFLNATIIKAYAVYDIMEYFLLDKGNEWSYIETGYDVFGGKLWTKENMTKVGDSEAVNGVQATQLLNFSSDYQNLASPEDYDLFSTDPDYLYIYGNNQIESTRWYLDSDGDGFGDASNSKDAVVQPAGYVADSSDCNDADASIYPEALDTVGDGIDQDCSGSDAVPSFTGVLEAEPDKAIAPASVTFYVLFAKGAAPFTYNYTFGDGTQELAGTAKQAHTYQNKGTYTAQVNVIDNNGASYSLSTTVDIIDSSDISIFESGLDSNADQIKQLTVVDDMETILDDANTNIETSLKSLSNADDALRTSTESSVQSKADTIITNTKDKFKEFINNNQAQQDDIENISKAVSKVVSSMAENSLPVLENTLTDIETISGDVFTATVENVVAKENLSTTQINEIKTDKNASQAFFKTKHYLLDDVVDTSGIQVDVKTDFKIKDIKTVAANRGLTDQQAASLFNAIESTTNADQTIALSAVSKQTIAQIAETIFNNYYTAKTVSDVTVEPIAKNILITFTDNSAVSFTVKSISIVKDNIPTGLYQMPDGTAVGITGSYAVTFAPYPVFPVDFTAEVIKLGINPVLSQDGALSLDWSNNSKLSMRIGWQYFQNNSFNSLTTSFTVTGGTDPSAEAYSYMVTYDTGLSQLIPPAVKAMDCLTTIFDTLFPSDYSISSDTGVITIGTLKIKPDYVFTPKTSIDYNAITAAGGVVVNNAAFEIKDYNSDGLDDYGFYSDDPMGFQILYTISK